MIRYGAKSMPYGGWWAIPPRRGQWLDDSRRFRRLPEFAAPEGNSSRDQERHAGRRDRLRSAEERRFLGGNARRVPEESRIQLDQRRTLEGPQLPSGIRTRILRRDVPRRTAAVHRRTRPAQPLSRARRPRAHAEAAPSCPPTAAPKRTCSAPPKATASSPSTSSPTSTTPARSTKKTSPRTWSFTTPTSATRAA